MKKGFVISFLTVSAFLCYCIFDSSNVSAQEPKEPTPIYSEWTYKGETNCLVSPDGVLFSKEYVKYEKGEAGMCKKYTRVSVD